MKRERIVLLAVLLIATVTLTGCLVGGSYVISGRVTDTQGNGIGDVRLVIAGGTNATVLTGVDGKWQAKVTGTVKITPEPQTGYLFTPAERTGITKASKSNINFERFSNEILWYMYPDPDHFIGGQTTVAPPDDLTGSKYEVVVQDTVLTEAPSGYDVLVLSDVGAGFDLTEFDGRIIVTIDSGVSPLMYWMTGEFQEEIYWDYETHEELEWIKPITGSEVGTSGDARIYTALDGELGFTRRHDLLQATSFAAGLEGDEGFAESDDVVLYQIEIEQGSWWWLHVGPHFGDYEEEVYVARTWEIINYALDLINGYDPDFPPLPVVEVGITSLTTSIGRN